MNSHDKLTRALWIVFIAGGIITAVADAQANLKWQAALVATFSAVISVSLGIQLGREYERYTMKTKKRKGKR